jgi:hypothetical protein
VAAVMPAEEPRSGIEEIQQDRAVVDAVVQAGLSARMAYSLVGGMAGAVRSQLEDATRARELVEQAQSKAEAVKNADMALDHPIAGDERGAEQLREAAQALDQAAEAYRTAAELAEVADPDGA